MTHLPRPSLLVQYLCFGSLALAPWLPVLGVPWQTTGLAAACWTALGLMATLWHRNVVEA